MKVGSDGIVVPEDREATFMLAGPGETIQVGRVVKIEAREDSLCLETAKAERYWFSYDLVLGVRLRTAKTAKAQAAGFGR